jgi:hypothetical protein
VADVLRETSEEFLEVVERLAGQYLAG